VPLGVARMGGKMVIAAWHYHYLVLSIAELCGHAATWHFRENLISK